MSSGARRAGARLAASNAVKIRAALASSADPHRIVSGYLDTHPQVTDSLAQDRARARAGVMLHVSLDTGALKRTLRRTYAEFYALGTNEAYEKLRAMKGASADISKGGVATASSKPGAQVPTFSINWSTWEPGNEAASLLLSPPGGLQKLLGDIEIKSRGITDTTHDRLGSALADGLSRGLAPNALADSISETLSDPSRALTIALTEGQRAKIEANVQSYAENGVEQIEWTVNDPDDIDCIENDGEIVNLGDEFKSGDTQPPVHPNCQCDVIPVMPDLSAYPAIDLTTGEDIEESVTADLHKYSESQPREANGQFGSGGGDFTVSKLEAAYHAKSVYEKASHAEPAATRAMHELADKHGGKLVGLDYRLKSVESLTRKIADDAKKDFKSVAEAARNISDSVRYTMVSDPKEYAAQARAVTEDLRSRGFDVTVKNYWQEGSNYKGVNVALVDHSGQKIELQFHTAESFAMKESTNHPIYEEYRKLDDTSTPHGQELNAQMVANSATLSTPSGLDGFGVPKIGKSLDNKLQVRYYRDEGGL